VSTTLAGRALERLLEDVAAATPAPGGGCAAAWTCGLAASLVEMTAAFTIGRADLADRHERMRAIAARSRSLRVAALELGERELHSFEPVLAAMRAPRDDPARPERLAAALSDAAQAPFEIARAAAEVAELAIEAAEAGAPHLRGDALTGASLAGAACEAAARLVKINLAAQPRDERLTALAELTARAAAARRGSLGT
jgi:formiminotetrahydrofolate cyclodeaminase